MKKVFFLLMLTVITAIGASAQITMIGSNSVSTGIDTLDNTETIYFTTPVNALTSSVSGKYGIEFTETYISGTNTVRSFIVEGTVDGTNWFKMYNTPGTDGMSCDTITTAALTTGSRSYRYVLLPIPHTKTVYSTVYTVCTPRVARLRIRCVGITATQSTKLSGFRCLPIL